MRLLHICSLLSAAIQAGTLEGRIVGVHDGKSVTMLDRDHRQHKIRLNGIDAPELGQPSGRRPSWACRPMPSTAPRLRSAKRLTAMAARSVGCVSMGWTLAWRRSEPGWRGSSNAALANSRRMDANNTPRPRRPRGRPVEDYSQTLRKCRRGSGERL